MYRKLQKSFASNHGKLSARQQQQEELCVKGEDCGSSSVKDDEAFCDRLSRLVDYHAAVNAGSWVWFA